MDIFQFAKELNVSPTTVSRAISGKGRISARTRELVLSRMSEHSYVPNPCAQQVATGRSGMVALYLPNERAISDSFALQMIKGVQRALHDCGSALVLDSADESRKASPILQWVTSGAIDGVVLITGDEESIAQANQHASASSPYVLYTNMDGEANVVAASESPYIGAVILDTDRGAREVAKMLVGLGHKRIAFITVGSEFDSVLAGFSRELSNLGVLIDDAFIPCEQSTHADGAKALRQLMSRAQTPTAVFCRNDDLASGALSEAKSLGIRVPEQLSIVGHDDTPIAALLDPPLTSVQVDCYEIGRMIVETLQDLTAASATPEKVRHSTPRLIVRQSVASAP